MILIDGGSTDKKALGSQRIIPFLESRGIGEISCAVVSHGDWDHISGLRELMEEGVINIERLVLPAHGRGQEAYEELSKLAEGRGSQVFYMNQGEKLTEKGKTGLTLTCLYPKEPGKAQKQIEDRNNHSLVLLAEYGVFSMVLTGDLEYSGEKAMLAEKSLGTVKILKAGHHGARESTSQELLDRLRPCDVIISCGKDNSYGHPKDVTVKKLESIGAKIYRTDKDGTIILSSDGENISFETVKTDTNG